MAKRGKAGFGALKASLRRLSGANRMSVGSGLQTTGMFLAVGSAIAPPNPISATIGAIGAVTAVYGSVQTFKGTRLMKSADRAARIEKMRSSRAGVAKGAASRSGKAVQASNRSGGSRRVASAAPTGGNGQVKGYYRQQAGKSVFVQSYQRV